MPETVHPMIINPNKPPLVKKLKIAATPQTRRNNKYNGERIANVTICNLLFFLTSGTLSRQILHLYKSTEC